MLIRQANEGEAARIASIWHRGWLDGHLGYVPEELVEARSEASFLERATARTAGTTVLVTDDIVAGFVMVVADEVEQVYLDGNFRGSGLAAELLAEAERQVVANGHGTAWLAVVAGNARARRFYERQGWVDGGVFDYGAGRRRRRQGRLDSGAVTPIHQTAPAVTTRHAAMATRLTVGARY